MKRTVLLTATLAITFLHLASYAWSQPAPRSSVPNLLNFQGRLTDNLGNPVANGAHTVDFYIFPVRTGGVSVWSESQTPTTTGGLFTTQLGSVNPLPVTLFQDYDSLFLEIVADAQTITPRTHLSSAPYSRAAGGLEVRSNYFAPETLAVATNNFWAHSLSTYGTDGQEQVRLWGDGWGEILLFDGDPSNDLNAILDANAFAGGSLDLLGTSSLRLNAGTTGDATAVLPTDAVNSGEMLDEPGIASGYNSSFYTLTSVDVNLDSAIITVPSAGYIVVIASAIDYPAHASGTRDYSRYTISTFSGSIDFSYISAVSTPAADASDFDKPLSVALHRVDAVGPGTYRYYFVADCYTGNCGAYQPKITATYFPTLYGTVDVTPKPVARPIAPPSDNSLGNSAEAGQATAVQHITVADHNARLEAERAKQIAELEARVRQLEEQSKLHQNPSQQSSEYPRKER